jgi:hypothetical protein
MPSNARIESFAAFLKSTFSQQDILNALKEEIGSLSLAKLSMQGLIDDLPKDAFAWQKAITQSHVLKGPRDWLFILPQNHGIAGFYPISLAFLCQRNLSVRIPKNFDKEHSSLKLFLNALAKWDNKHRITMLNDLFKLGSNIFVGEQSGIFLFGSDETIDLIRSLTSSPLVAYGTTLGIAIISDSPSINTLQHLSRDYLSLGQRGCRSTRIAFVISEDPASDLSTLATMLQQVSRQQRPDPLSLQAKAALDYEDLGFQRKGNRRPPRTSDDDFLIPILGFDKSTPINHWLGGAELTLPLIVTPDIESIFAYIRSINAHIILTVDSFLLNQISPQISDTFNEICPLGNAQSVPWDGTYQGQPLFQALSLP